MCPAEFLKELSILEPEIADQTAVALSKSKKSSGGSWKSIEVQLSDFEAIPSISVDYAVFEKSKNVMNVPCDIGWSDIGSWIEFGETHPIDDNYNHIHGETVCSLTENCTIYGSDRLIVTTGIKDLIICDTNDVLLVVHKDCAHEIRRIVDDVKARAPELIEEFPTVHRPWGNYTVLDEGVGFKLKRIEVMPGEKLSLQSHKYRNEHWVVVQGKAIVTNGNKLVELAVDQSVYIPAGTKHRLQNPGTDKLILIEVQNGSYLGEDDIERYEDVYGRL